jgi:DNA-3-methyladenine glycosylase
MTHSFKVSLPRSFYTRPALQVARDLLGQTLIHETPGGRISGKIVETEAYIGEEDLACHARAGRTARTEVMYGEPGHAYIYLTYGMYWMLNLVAEPKDRPAAVLIRAVEPLEGRELMLENRLRGSSFHKAERVPKPEQMEENLTNGPARLCLAFGITGVLNASDLTKPPLYVEEGERVSDTATATSPRIGVAYAGAWAKMPWRFFIRDNPFVSR